MLLPREVSEVCFLDPDFVGAIPRSAGRPGASVPISGFVGANAGSTEKGELAMNAFMFATTKTPGRFWRGAS
jgi:hypothetical protein